MTTALTAELRRQADAHWHTARYSSVGPIYLYDTPLLNRTLTLADIRDMQQTHRVAPYVSGPAASVTMKAQTSL